MTYEKLALTAIITISALVAIVWIIRKLVNWFGNISIMPDDYDEPFTIDELKSLKTNKNQ